MGKYIRTKDGIWKYNQKKNSAERPNKEFECNQIWLNIKEQDILKKANTIDELCDAFIHRHCFYYKLSELPDVIKEYDYKEIYGAIWTEWGLKYVAKMNENGELELL